MMNLYNSCPRQPTNNILRRPSPTPFHRSENAVEPAQPETMFEVLSYPTAAFSAHKNKCEALSPPPDQFLLSAQIHPPLPEDSDDHAKKRVKLSKSQTTTWTEPPLLADDLAVKPTPSQVKRKHVELSSPPVQFSSSAQTHTAVAEDSDSHPKKRVKTSESQPIIWTEPPLVADNLAIKPTPAQGKRKHVELSSPPVQFSSSAQIHSTLAEDSANHPKQCAKTSESHPAIWTEPPLVADDLAIKPTPAQEKRKHDELSSLDAQFPSLLSEQFPSSLHAQFPSSLHAQFPTSEETLSTLPEDSSRRRKKHAKRRDAQLTPWVEPPLADDDMAFQLTPAQIKTLTNKIGYKGREVEARKRTNKRRNNSNAPAAKRASRTAKGKRSHKKKVVPQPSEPEANTVTDDTNITATDADGIENENNADNACDQIANPEADMGANAPADSDTIPRAALANPEAEAGANAPANSDTIPCAALTSATPEYAALSAKEQPQRMSNVRWSAFESRIHATNPTLLNGANADGLVAEVRKRSADFLKLARAQERRKQARPGAAEARDKLKDDDDDDDDAAAFDKVTKRKMAALVREVELKRRLGEALRQWREEQVRAEQMEDDVRRTLAELLPRFGLSGMARTEALLKFDIWFAFLSAEAKEVCMKLVMEDEEL